MRVLSTRPPPYTYGETPSLYAHQTRVLTDSRQTPLIRFTEFGSDHLLERKTATEHSRSLLSLLACLCIAIGLSGLSFVMCVTLAGRVAVD